jgi:hypothetical protein
LLAKTAHVGDLAEGKVGGGDEQQSLIAARLVDKCLVRRPVRSESSMEGPWVDGEHLGYGGLVDESRSEEVP